MKKFIACTFLIVLTVMLVYYFTGGVEEIATGRVIRVAEAAFDEDGHFTDATAFLVGDFSDDWGNVYSFSGGGRFQRSSPEHGVESGEYSLRGDGSVTVMRLSFEHGDPTSYRFELNSSDGDILLTGVDGSTVYLQPVR